MEEVLLECMITAKFVGFVKKSVHIAHTQFEVVNDQLKSEDDKCTRER